MERFEYRVVTYSPSGLVGGKVDEYAFQDRLNALGSNGWELVSSVSSNMYEGTTRSIIVIFKRKKQ